MNALKNRLIQYPFIAGLVVKYYTFDSRDRFAFNALVVFFVALFLYLFIWQSAQDFVSDAEIQRDKYRSLVEYMHATESDARAVSKKGNRTSNSGQSLVAQVNKSAQNARIELDRLQPQGDDQVSVWFEEVQFNALMQWLGQMRNSLGISVNQISAEKIEKAGRVNARLVLEK